MLPQHSVRDCLNLLRGPLHEYVRREMAIARAAATNHGYELAQRPIDMSLISLRGERPDTLALFRVVLDRWDLVFAKKWDARKQFVVRQLKHARNRYAHEEEFADEEVKEILEYGHELALALGDRTCAAACERLLSPAIAPISAPSPVNEPSPPVALKDAATSPPSMSLSERNDPLRAPTAHKVESPAAKIVVSPAVVEPARVAAPPTVARSVSRVSAPQPKPAHSYDVDLYVFGDDLAEFLETLGWPTVDKRARGGCLWVIGDDEELAVLLRDLAIAYRIVFQFAPDGGRATQHEPAWFTSSPA